MQHTADTLWLEILTDLDDSANSDVYLRQVTPRSLNEECLHLAVPSHYTQAEIENRFLSAINRMLTRRIGPDCLVKISVETSLAKDLQPEQNGSISSENKNGSEPTGLNPSYVFDTFVVGNSNRICDATARSVAENPGSEFNPLFIYGGVGLGKTHLLHAIGNRVQQKTPGQKVLYVTSEMFMNEYIESIVNRSSAQGFRTKYREADLLLIDDIQFLQRKEGTLEEFFNTFNVLHGKSNQMVMSCDRSPSMLENIEERLCSRFEWGMVAEIDKPNYELRFAILKSKCQEQDLKDVDDEVLNYIAEIVTANIRQLEGTLLRLHTQAVIYGVKLDIDFARQALNDTSTSTRRAQENIITAATIQKVVADHFQLKSRDLTSTKRTKSLVYPRQIAMYLCRELTQLSLTDIADSFNRQNHRTITYACEQMEIMLEDEETKKLIQLLLDELN